MNITSLFNSVDVIAKKDGTLGKWEIVEGDCVLKDQMIGRFQERNEPIFATVNGIVRNLSLEGTSYKIGQILAVLEIPRIDTEPSRFNTFPITSLLYYLSKIKEKEELNEFADESIIQTLNLRINEYRRILLKMYQTLLLKNDFQSSFPRFAFTAQQEDKYLKKISKDNIHSKSLNFPRSSLEVNSYKSNFNPLESLTQNLSNYITSKSISTYPFNSAKEKRDGDPICDKYRLKVSSNYMIVAMADGCNWGKQPQEAATKATKNFVDFLSKNRFQATNTYQLAKYCLQGIQTAHNSIIYKKYHHSTVGTATLLGGVLFRVTKRKANSDSSELLSPRPLSRSDSLSNSYLKVIRNSPRCIAPSLRNTSQIPEDFRKKSTPRSHNNSPRKSLNSSPRKNGKSPRHKRTRSQISDDNNDDNNNNNNNNINNININNINNNNINQNNDNKNKKNKRKKKWGFITANIGDCKAYLWQRSSQKLSEITENTRENPSDPSDCGGRIGPYIDRKDPDLRNLAVNYITCHEGDIIFVCSDGVYDNFDPELLGKPVADVLNKPDDTTEWNQLNPRIATKLKTNYQLKKMTKLLQQPNSIYNKKMKNSSENILLNSNDSVIIIDSNDGMVKMEDELRLSSDSNFEELRNSKNIKNEISPINLEEIKKNRKDQTTINKNRIGPKLIVERTIEHCLKTTTPARKFLEENNKKLPKDFTLYPGKMDHATIIAFRVGDIPIDDLDLKEQIGCIYKVYQKEDEDAASFFHFAKRCFSLDEPRDNNNIDLTTLPSIALRNTSYINETSENYQDLTLSGINSQDKFTDQQVMTPKKHQIRKIVSDQFNIMSPRKRSARRKSASKKIWDQLFTGNSSSVRSSSKIDEFLELRSTNNV